MGELSQIDNAYHETTRTALLALRYKLRQGLTAGLLAQGLNGQRHDDDWVLRAPQQWHWRSTKNRLELISGPELTYRRWLGQSLWASEVRGRYLFNTRNSFQRLSLRAGLLRFYQQGSFSLALEGFVPLNYSEHTFDEFWLYAAHQLKLTQKLSLGHTLAFGQQRWSQPEHYPGVFKEVFETLRFIIGLNYYWDL